MTCFFYIITLRTEVGESKWWWNGTNLEHTPSRNRLVSKPLNCPICELFQCYYYSHMQAEIWECDNRNGALLSNTITVVHTAVWVSITWTVSWSQHFLITHKAMASSTVTGLSC